MAELAWLLFVRMRPFRRLFPFWELVDLRLEDHSLSFSRKVSLVSVVFDSSADFLGSLAPGQLWSEGCRCLRQKSW